MVRRAPEEDEEGGLRDTRRRAARGGWLVRRGKTQADGGSYEGVAEIWKKGQWDRRRKEDRLDYGRSWTNQGITEGIEDPKGRV